MAGIDDYGVLAVARPERVLLVTADKDFGDLVFRNGETQFGVLLIRPEDDTAGNAGNTVAAIEHHGPELLNRFSVLAGRTLRIRAT
jgi:predicted nuclease of predicted toxin-antitoxin system